MDTGRAPGKTVEQVIKKLEDNLVSGAYAIGAQVAEIGRLQQKGFPYIFVPKQF